MLNLHIRLFGMENCAYLLMSSLPFAWIAIGCLLLMVSLILSVLFVLKSREVATLKKQCEELRETMRMMRYEEANLARMLHTASKPVVRPEVQEREQKDNQEQACELEVVPSLEIPETAEQPETAELSEIAEESEVAEQPEALELSEVVDPSETVELPDEAAHSDSSESLEVFEQSDNSESLEVAESLEVPESLEVVESADIVESSEPLETEGSATPIVEISHPQKHPINERRPAIPTDLFAAWFAENDEEQEDISVESAEMAVPSIDEPAIAEEAVEETAIAEDFNEKPVDEASIVEKHAVETVVVEEVLMEMEPVVETPVVESSAAQDAVVSAIEASQDDVSNQQTELKKEDERFCRKLERIVSTRLRNPNLNIDIIAAQFGIGRTNFYRKVRELMGMSPNDYLRKCRMERAAELLRGSELPVSDVCAQVGIPDAQYFSRVFKTHFGVTPSAYRENNNQ